MTLRFALNFGIHSPYRRKAAAPTTAPTAPIAPMLAAAGAAPPVLALLELEEFWATAEAIRATEATVNFIIEMGKYHHECRTI